MSQYHVPVLLNESVSALNIEENPNGIFIDVTFGGGGHSREILSRLGPKGKLIAFDRDSDAIKNAPKDKRLTLIHNNFRFMRNFVRALGYCGKIDGILGDLGVSSHQFDTGERGFSFRFDAKLDMRMNTLGGKSAADIVNSYTQEELTRIFKIYGELDKPWKAAELICKWRENSPIETTGDLGKAVAKLYTSFNEHKFLAQLYQALRIEVNMEMRALEDFLNGTTACLKPNGRLSVITYHSLEDRMVKNFMKAGNTEGKEGKDFYGRSLSPFTLVNRKPILPPEEEIASNSRSRSAKLRVAEFTPDK
ncbi:MAG: 16S rRNA (cytosine(1402)-N(4))-methyltransferase RsmH [Bacteroidales bacterium]|nr:16S rRNA (cytosine(1402)-N(4))-methyltransferase RsmH [Bacteroidales bacterium]